MVTVSPLPTKAEKGLLKAARVYDEAW